jgi:hypothetical protein
LIEDWCIIRQRCEQGGRTGTLNATGTISGDSLSLDLTYDYGALTQFSGQLDSPSVLSGSLHLGPSQSLTPSIPVTFDKKV